MRAWHVTTERNLQAIMHDGLSGPSYWSTDEDLAAYYADTIREEGEEPRLIEIDLGQIEATWLEPDLPGIEEPISFILRTNDDSVHEAWRNSDQSWSASVDIIRSFRCRETLPPELLQEVPLPGPCL